MKEMRYTVLTCLCATFVYIAGTEMDILKKITEEFKIQPYQTENAVKLLDDGNTVPFIARYRKEVTGSIDDQLLRELSDRLTYLRSLQKRKDEVRQSIEEQGKLTDEIVDSLEKSETLTEVEDIYRPYKPRRKTRASIAREKGLEPFAEIIFAQDMKSGNIFEIASEYINEEKGVESADEAITGSLDIIAENISDNAEFRKDIRRMTFEYGIIKSKQAKNEDSVYSMYYDYSEAVSKLPGHRILAINRGENEEFLKVTLDIDEYLILNYLYNKNIIGKSIFTSYVETAVNDAYTRLIKPSIEREIRSNILDTACESAILVFADNLHNLLMQAPIKGKNVIGLDPGYRTGCKVAVVDKTGKVLDTAVIYPAKPYEKVAEAEKTVLKLVLKYNADIIAIGNGTASKETEIFASSLIKNNNLNMKYMMVSEAGASVYSASKLAAEEFPDFDVTQRSAVSIARRMQDPLAELVKIEPKAIGVGQYQHDMKPARLTEVLGGVVEDCVNTVGVDLNTASHSLLSYVAGINATSAKNIVKYREENGEFKAITEIKKVPKIGAKAFEQCAGFLRIPFGKHPLDNTGVHPESYDAALKLLDFFGYTEKDIKNGGISGLMNQVEDSGISDTAQKLAIGELTLVDIIKELEKPGRDIRDDFAQPILRDDVLDMADLKEGMELIGTVRNVCDFGAFVDIGVHQDGLVHVSQITSKYIKHPNEVLSVGDIVNVKILSVDVNKKRISLTMKK